MMYLKVVLFFVLLGMIPSIVIGQRIKIGDKMVAYKDQYVRYKEADHIFEEHKLAHQYYKESIKDFESSKHLGIASLSTLAIGALLIFSDTGSDLKGFGAISLILIAPTLGTLALLDIPAAESNKRKAIETFNYGKPIGMQNNRKISLSFSSTTSGLGLVLSF